MWRWPQALQPSEQQVRLIVRAEDLKMWLDGELDDESLPFGPVTAPIRSPSRTRYALFAQNPLLTPQPGQFLPLLASQPVKATALIARCLRHPVTNRLGGRLKLLREILGATPRSH
jgi:hypothetical protein